MSLACDLCEAICCKDLIITITSFDMIRIRDKLKKNVDEFCCLYQPKFIRVNWQTVIESVDGFFVLALKSRPCIFLSGNKCSIFSFAPLSCKCYPHNMFGSFSNLAVCKEIPKVIIKISNPGFSYVSKFKEEYEAYIEIVKEVSKKKLRKHEILPALEKLTEEKMKELEIEA